MQHPGASRALEESTIALMMCNNELWGNSLRSLCLCAQTLTLRLLLRDIAGLQPMGWLT